MLASNILIGDRGFVRGEGFVFTPENIVVAKAEHDFRLEVPFSELAMHFGVAGKVPEAVAVTQWMGRSPVYVDVKINDTWYSGLPGELVPPALWEDLERPGAYLHTDDLFQLGPHFWMNREAMDELSGVHFETLKLKLNERTHAGRGWVIWGPSDGRKAGMLGNDEKRLFGLTILYGDDLKQVKEKWATNFMGGGLLIEVNGGHLEVSSHT